MVCSPSTRPHHKAALSKGSLGAQVSLGARAIPVGRGLLEGVAAHLSPDIRRKGGAAHAHLPRHAQ